LLAVGAGVEAVLVVPGDLPAFSRSEAMALIAAWQASSRPQVAVTASGMQALCAVVPVTALPVVQRYLDSGRRSAHGLWQDMDAQPVRCADEAAFANLNTPEDVRRWQR
jgi:molybdopterin-guanine dinucleotide biosynthesis protein A